MLKQTFLEVCLQYSRDTTVSEKLWSEIETSYTERNRYYHTLFHLESIRGYLVPLRSEIQHWDRIIFAWAYHDIVYDALQSDNEEKSALVAYERLTELNAPDDLIENVRKTILKTKGHSESDDRDTNIFLDADLSILGAEPEDYREYTRQIRQEYKLVPGFLYTKGRKKVVEHFLKMPAVYKTQYFEGLEQKARFNLQEELKTLE